MPSNSDVSPGSLPMGTGHCQLLLLPQFPQGTTRLDSGHTLHRGLSALGMENQVGMPAESNGDTTWVLMSLRRCTLSCRSPSSWAIQVSRVLTSASRWDRCTLLSCSKPSTCLCRTGRGGLGALSRALPGQYRGMEGQGQVAGGGGGKERNAAQLEGLNV